MNRRSFLMAAGAASVAGNFTRRAKAQTPPPSAKLCHACIGVGGMMGGVDLSNFISHPRLQIVALCDVDKNNLAVAAEKVPGARTTTGAERRRRATTTRQRPTPTTCTRRSPPGASGACTSIARSRSAMTSESDHHDAYREVGMCDPTRAVRLLGRDRIPCSTREGALGGSSVSSSSDQRARPHCTASGPGCRVPHLMGSLAGNALIARLRPRSHHPWRCVWQDFGTGDGDNQSHLLDSS